MITSEVAKRIWTQLGYGWFWIETAKTAELDTILIQLDQRRRAALESLAECEELHAIVSAERAARRYDDAQDPLAGVAEWYKASKACFDDTDEHFKELREHLNGVGMKVVVQLFNESEKARKSFVQLRKEQAERQQKESGE